MSRSEELVLACLRAIEGGWVDAAAKDWSVRGPGSPREREAAERIVDRLRELVEEPPAEIFEVLTLDMQDSVGRFSSALQNLRNAVYQRGNP